MRGSKPSRLHRYLLCVLGGALVLFGLLVLTDRPGLRLSYHALPITAFPGPVFSELAAPQIDSRAAVTEVLVSQELFDLRWRGWLLVDRPADYEFRLEADEAAYLEIGETRVAETSRAARRFRSAPVELRRGLHPVEVGFSQTGGRARLALWWGVAGGELVPLAGRSLMGQRPVWLRSVLRRGPGADAQGLFRRLIGLVLLAVGPVLVWRGSRPVHGSIRRYLLLGKGLWRQILRSRTGWIILLVLLASLTFVAILPLTASTTDGDDVRYMDGARFNKQMGWNMNRYAHIYALKAFMELTGGDAFQASRLYWAFMFAVTVLAIAICTRALASDRALGVFGVAVLLLFSQSYLFGGIGAAYADYSAMMFVVTSLAVFMHGHATQPTSSWKRHALALGVLAIAAAKSKEPGVIVLWLALGMVWSAGRLDWRRFVRRLGWWTVGAGTAYLLLMTLDGMLLGDFWFSLRLESVAGAKRLKDAAEGIWQLSRWAWLDVAWEKGPQRVLSTLVLVAAGAVMVRPRPAEERWVVWMPLAFMAMMITIHPPIGSPRYLFPVVPVACVAVVTAAWGYLREPSASTSVNRLARLALAIALLLLAGPGWMETAHDLRRQRTAQRGDWTLYPWQIFRQEIEGARPRQIVVSERLYRNYLMTGKSKTRDRIARLYFQRRHLRLRERREPVGSSEIALITRHDYERWSRARPELAARAVFDPSGQIVLLRSR